MNKSFYHKFDNIIEDRIIRKVKQLFGLVLAQIQNKKPFQRLRSKSIGKCENKLLRLL